MTSKETLNIFLLIFFSILVYFTDGSVKEFDGNFYEYKYGPGIFHSSSPLWLEINKSPDRGKGELCYKLIASIPINVIKYVTFSSTEK